MSVILTGMETVCLEPMIGPKLDPMNEFISLIWDESMVRYKKQKIFQITHNKKVLRNLLDIVCLKTHTEV